MGRSEIRGCSKQIREMFKSTNKIVRNAIDDIESFMRDTTERADYILTSMGSKRLNDPEIMESILGSTYRIFKIRYDNEGFAKALMEATRYTMSDSDIAFLELVNGVTDDYDDLVENTLMGCNIIKLYSDIKKLDLSDSERASLEREYKGYLSHLATLKVASYVYGTEPNQLITNQEDMNLTEIYPHIEAWFYLKHLPKYPYARLQWIYECDTLHDVYDYFKLEGEDRERVHTLFTAGERDLCFNGSCTDKSKKLEDVSKIILRGTAFKQLELLGDILDMDEKERLELIDERLYGEVTRNFLILKKRINFCITSIHLRMVYEIRNDEQAEFEKKIEQLENKLSRAEIANKKLKDTNTKLTVKANETEKELKQLKKNHTHHSEVIQLKEENQSLKNQVEKLKSHINSLKNVDNKEVPTSEQEVIDSPICQEVDEEEIPFDDMLNELNKHKITILGGPTNFSTRIREYLPKAVVVDRGSKFGEIRLGKSDYVVIYWKMIGHARTMKAESQAKRVGAKTILVDSTNKEIFCKQIYSQL